MFGTTYRTEEFSPPADWHITALSDAGIAEAGIVWLPGRRQSGPQSDSPDFLRRARRHTAGVGGHLLSYKMPTYRVGRRRIHVGCGSTGYRSTGGGRSASASSSRYPHLRTSKGTIQLRPEDAAGITDDELQVLIRAALDDGTE